MWQTPAASCVPKQVQLPELGNFDFFSGLGDSRFRSFQDNQGCPTTCKFEHLRSGLPMFTLFGWQKNDHQFLAIVVVGGNMFMIRQWIQKMYLVFRQTSRIAENGSMVHHEVQVTGNGAMVDASCGQLTNIAFSCCFVTRMQYVQNTTQDGALLGSSFLWAGKQSQSQLGPCFPLLIAGWWFQSRIVQICTNWQNTELR